MFRLLVVVISLIHSAACLTAAYTQESAPTSDIQSNKSKTEQFGILSAKELHAELTGNTFYSTRGWHFYIAPEGKVYRRTNQGSSRLGDWFISIDGEYCRQYGRRPRCFTWGQRGEWFEMVSSNKRRRHVLRRVTGNPENYSPEAVTVESLPLPAPPPPKDIFYRSPSPKIPVEIASLLGK